MTDSAGTARQSFADFFAVEIAAGLPELEEARKDRVRATYTRAFGTAFVVAIAAVIVWFMEQPVAAVLLLVSGLGLGLFWVLSPSRQHRKAVRDFFIPPLLRFLGDVDYHREPGRHFEIERFRRSGMLPAVDKAKVALEDLVVGRYRDTDYRLVEARLKPKNRSKNKAAGKLLFAGLLCDISVPQPFSGRVLLVDEPAGAEAKTTLGQRDSAAGLSPVALDHPGFEKRWQVYSDSPRAARGLLQPALLDSLLAIADDLGVAAVRCAFFEGRFLISLPQHRNLFEIGRLHRSLEHAEEDLRRLATEFTIPHRLIDNLHGERQPLVPET